MSNGETASFSEIFSGDLQGKPYQGNYKGVLISP